MSLLGKCARVVVQVQPLDKCRYNDYYGFNEGAQAFRKKPVARGLPRGSAVPGIAARGGHSVARANQVLKTEDLSATQYNVLRILRGTPEGLACGEIASRMITRDPDVTRLLDRLEKRELISRCRETGDRRTVMVRITPDGLDMLARLDEPVQAAHRKQLQHLGRERLHNLAELLRASRSQVV